MWINRDPIPSALDLVPVAALREFLGFNDVHVAEEFE